MFRNYTLTLGNSSNSYKFNYELELHRPAQEWANIMQSVNADSLKSGLNPWHGLSRSTIEKVNRLNELILLMNEWLPAVDRITYFWDDADPQGSLNKLHIHFPLQEKNETDSNRLSQLSEYNDIIHGLEDIIRLPAAKEYIWLLMIPSRNTEVALTDDDYKYFRPDRFFGELCLHYPHVGRHPLELLKSKDFTCPLDQIVPQRAITSYHSLRFYDDASSDQYKSWFEIFYKKSTLAQAYRIDDPKLAFGFITLGKLITVDDKILPKEEVLSIVKTTNTVLDWSIS